MTRPIGQVDQLASGRWRARLPVDGKRITVGSFATESEARAELERAAVVAHGATYEPTDSLARYGERVLQRSKAKAAERDLYVWGAHVVGSPLGRMRVAAVRTRHVREWAESLPVAVSTARSYVHVVARVFRRAVADDLVTASPTTGVRLESDPDAAAAWTTLTVAEQEALLGCDAIPLRERAVIAMALYTGLRAGELCALRTTSVGPDAVEVRFGGPPSQPTKTRRVRHVPLLPAARTWWAIASEWSTQIALPGPSGTFRTTHRVLSQQRDGGRWRTGWTLALRSAGITRRVRWHDLRHTFGSALVNGDWGRSWSLSEVAEMLGHASTRMTERYVHTATAHVQAAASQTPGGFAPRLAPRPPDGTCTIEPESAETETNQGAAGCSSGTRPATPTNVVVSVPSWGDRGADALRSLLAGDASAAVALVSQAVDARREADEIERAWARWVRTGNVAALVDAIEAMGTDWERRAAR